MCGLVAVVNKYSNGFSKEQLDVFHTLLYIDVLRGEDSTGVFGVSNNGSVTVVKEASEASVFQASAEYNALLTGSFSKGAALVGHNRKATRGNITDENAHPFIVDDKMVLVHNGTLLGDHKKHADVEVDSHALAHLIHKEQNVESALSKVDGAWALIWYDVDKQEINFLRNAQRPLFWMETDNAYVWCSQQNMLEFVSSQFNLRYKGKSPSISNYSEDTLTTYKITEGRGVSVDSKKLVIKREYPKSQGPAWAVGGHSGSFHGRQRVLSREVAMACGYYDHDDDSAWEDEITTIPTKLTDSSPSKDVDTFERNLARTTNKRVLYEELQPAMKDLPFGTSALAQTIDYFPRNGKDGTDGWWLYSFLLDDPDILVRFHCGPKYYDERRVLELASSECIYEVTLGNKGWRAIEPNLSVISNDVAGLIMVDATKALLKSGLGMHASGVC